MKLQVLLLTALPMCLAQFSIQGPSDGNRRAQGLKFSQEKGIEYTDQKESLGAGDFTIQGATDGHSNFQIQGASDGHSNFAIHGASDGGASTFNIQGATDGHSQSIIQGPYDANQSPGKALQYNDPSGLRVNWRSFNRQQTRAQPEYVPQAAAPVQHAAPRHHPRPPPQPQPQPQPQRSIQPQPQDYKGFDAAPPQIKQLLQFQAQIPYLNIIPEPYRYDIDAATQAHIQQVQAQLQNDVRQAVSQSQSGPPPPPPPPPPSQYRPKARPHPRQKRQAPHQGAPQRQSQPQYQRISQPPPEPQPQYSPNLPPHLQDLLKYQAQIPYNIIANQIVYRPEKPYVPHRVDPQPAGPVQAQYQGQGGAFQGQTHTQSQVLSSGYQGQHPGGVRPVTENNY